MTRVLIALIILGALAIALVLYRSHTSDLNVDPHAREQIDKARKR